MPVEVRVPAVGESIVEATVGRWLKSEGDVVAAGDVLAELETDKVNVEVSAEQAGVLQQISCKEGDTVNVGQVIAIIADAVGAQSSPGSAAEGEVKGAIGKESDPAHTSPAIFDPAVRNGDANGAGDHEEAPVTSVARRLAEENNVDLRQMTGSGPNGKIMKDDVAGYIERRVPAAAQQAAVPVEAAAAAPARVPELPKASPPPPARPATPYQPAPSMTTPMGAGRREERKRMSRRRQTIAARLVEAQHTAAMLTTFNEVDMAAVMEVRKRRKESFKERNGVGLGFMSFFTKATIGALKAYPRLNAEIQGDEIVIKHYYDIGIAVGVEEGLVVPVMRDADRLSFAEIERQIGSLASKARDGKLTLAELQGGTFTITNGGIFGSLMSTPILNAPQVGILGMHKIQDRAVVVGGEIVIRPMMYLALSYDHRIVDGSEAVRCLVRIKELLEDPESLLLEG